MQKSTYSAPFKRRKQGKTNYSKRLAMAKTNRPRIVVRKTNKYVYLQAIQFNRDGDTVLVQANSKELIIMGWKNAARNTPAAYLAGYLLGIRAKKQNVETGIFDIGFNSPVHGNVCFAALKGLLDAGMKIPFEEKALPKEDRLLGNHLGKEIPGIVAAVKSAIEKEGA
jgi:large subunit ribosomal protein L18